MKNNIRDIIIIVIVGIVIITSAVFCILIFQNNKTTDTMLETDLEVNIADEISNEVIETSIDIEENIIVEEPIIENEVVAPVDTSPPAQPNNNSGNKPTNNNSSSSNSTPSNNNSASSNSTNNNVPAEPNKPISCNHSGLWFNSESEAEAYFKKEAKKKGDQYRNEEISYEEYVATCPDRAEYMSCAICGKYLLIMYYGN